MTSKLKVENKTSPALMGVHGNQCQFTGFYDPTRKESLIDLWVMSGGTSSRRMVVTVSLDDLLNTLSEVLCEISEEG